MVSRCAEIHICSNKCPNCSGGYDIYIIRIGIVAILSFPAATEQKYIETPPCTFKPIYCPGRKRICTSHARPRVHIVLVSTSSKPV